MALTYQIREFSKGESKTFEVWQCRTEKRSFGRPYQTWERLDELPSFAAAAAFISARAGITEISVITMSAALPFSMKCDAS